MNLQNVYIYLKLCKFYGRENISQAANKILIFVLQNILFNILLCIFIINYKVKMVPEPSGTTQKWHSLNVGKTVNNSIWTTQNTSIKYKQQSSETTTRTTTTVLCTVSKSSFHSFFCLNWLYLKHFTKLLSNKIIEMHIKLHKTTICGLWFCYTYYVQSHWLHFLFTTLTSPERRKPSPTLEQKTLFQFWLEFAF